YVTIKGKEKTIANIKKASLSSSSIFLAPDPDREGEAISWHLASLIEKPTSRLILHEITKDAIKNALSHPVEIDKNKVDAQQARRLLDRLVGYKISPLLGKRVRKGLSAGRVQSVALRLIVEREEEIEKFKPEEYWTITAKFKKDNFEFEATLEKKDGKKIKIKTKEEADKIIEEIKHKGFIVQRIEKKERKRSPQPPFITSKLQQEAFQRLSFSSKKTMLIAQQLYEGLGVGQESPTGLITYMRTDSQRVSDDAISEIRGYIKENFGENYLAAHKRVYKNKNKAQDAHEAIRPTFPFHNPDDIKSYISSEQFRLYDLITKRAIASQMEDALFSTTKVEIKSGDYTFVASGEILKFDGFMKVYPSDDKDKILPELLEKEALFLSNISSKQHFTQPPPRFNEGTLVKALEENGIGRPSTYATIIGTLLDRRYAEKREDKLHPTEIGRVVFGLLLENFPELFEIKFTAKMEDDLDKIEEGGVNWKDLLNSFYPPFSNMLENAEKNMKNIKKEKEKETDIVCEKCGGKMVIREGKYGEFLACKNFPKCRNAKPIGSDKQRRKPEETDKICPKCNSRLVIRFAFGQKFFGCSSYPKCRYTEQLIKITCPKCKEGILVFRKSKRGGFYGCSKYPDCTYITNNKFLEEKCENCNTHLVQSGKKIFCLNCNYTKEDK
ncbi:MAG: type I DNA topoisomerase, partial [bacterium]